MPALDLTIQEWEYISVLVAADIRADRERGLMVTVERHMLVWEKIQPVLGEQD